MGDIGSINHLSLFTCTRGVYLLLQIQIYVSVLQKSMGDIGSIKQYSWSISTRGVYKLLQIQIYVSVLQNGWVTFGQLSIKAPTRGVY